MTAAGHHSQQAPADAPGSDHAGLSFSSNVPRHLVHRGALAEVLLTDWRRTGDGAYLCAAQWPRGHSLYRVLDGHHDPLLAAETLRQTGILLAHSAEGVPLDWKFVMDGMAISVHPAGPRAGGAPADVLLEAGLSPLRKGTRSSAHLRLDVRFRHDGRVFATGGARMRCVAPALYRRLRGERAGAATRPAAVPPPVDARVVGMSTEADVVLGAALDRGAWPLRVRTEHPVLFDHPLDHVPGMLVFEGFRQAGRALLGLPGAQLTGCDVGFTRYLEFDPTPVVLARVRRRAASGASLAVRVVQDGRTAVSGTVEVCARDSGAIAAQRRPPPTPRPSPAPSSARSGAGPAAGVTTSRRSGRSPSAAGRRRSAGSARPCGPGRGRAAGRPTSPRPGGTGPAAW